MLFEQCNLNPSGKLVGDCVIRAIMKATHQSWLKVYNDLCQVGAEMFSMPNDRKTFYEYLKRLGWKKQQMPRKLNSNKKYTIAEFATLYDNQGVFIISLPKHLTVLENGKLIDTWDCSKKYMGNYWTK